MAAIVVGIVWNEAVLGRLLSADGSIERTPWRVAIGLFNGALIGFGILAIIRGRRFPSVTVRAAFLCASLSVGSALLLAADNLVGLASPPPRSVSRTVPKPYAVRDSYGILQAVPGRHAATVQRGAGEPAVHETTYTIDKHGRRATPFDSAGRRDRHLIVTGGSFAFGEGVGDEETLPYQLGMLTTRYRPYNYGFHGGSPADALMRFERRSIDEEVGEVEGVLLYLFIDDHISRSIGSMRTLAWGRENVHYGLTPEGELEFRGSFAAARPWRSYLSGQLGRSHILRVLRVDLPKYSVRHAEFTARILERLSLHYQRQFPGGEFYVVFYPGSVRADDMIRELEMRSIEVLEYPTQLSNDGVGDPEGGWLIEGDNHPTPAAYRALAEAVVGDLGLD